MTYPKVSSDPTSTSVPASPRFPEIEERILRYWDEDGTFQASVANREAGENGDNEFVFYDGPPFANGLPHYGHLLTGYVKDVVPRYQTMRGRRVERRFGWDTHGLPAELEAMSQLGIKTKEEILELGIEEFNAKCRSSVLKYTDEWREYVTRQARWVDFDNDYKTLNAPYMESVIWAFKQLYDKGLVYEGFRILPYCWNDQTPLSNHELRMDDDVYKNRQDPAVTVGFRLETGELALIWTTTPWTLPSNMGIAVNPDIDYVVVESDFTGSTQRYVLAESRLAAYRRELGGDDPEGLEARVVQRLKGSELVGRTYTPPFSYYQGHRRAHQVLGAEFVTTEDGTGIVHMSPGFGEDDKATLDAAGVETVVPVGPNGAFTFPVIDYEGLHVFDANPLIIDDLKAATRGEGDHGAVTTGTVLLRRETYDHSYPHCWRCRQPLIYMAVSSWFVEVTKFKDRMIELNDQITWVPEHVKDGQFGKWLENARDWSISRNRFWGSPIPVWKSDNPHYPRVDVYGSFEELERDFGVEVKDLHRPFIDRLTRPNPDDPTGQSTMRRVEDVLDVWFDSGSMSFAQVHYPFENAEWFEHHFPGDFIVEYIGQTRGWFYTLHVLAAGIFDRPAFSSCVSHGIVLGSDGQKMSKSLRNYPDVREVFDRDGADAMRWFLMSSPILRGGNLVVTEQGIRDGVRQVLIPLWNSWYFFSLYANAANGGQGLPGEVVHRVDRRARPLPAGQAARVRRAGPGPARRLRHRRRLRLHALLPRRPDQLVHPAQPGPVLGHGRCRLVGLRGGLRHALHRAGGRLPCGGAAAAAHHRGDLARPDRRPLGAPHRLARRLGPARRPRPRGRHGHCPRGLLDGVVAAQGQQPAGAAAAARPHRRGAGGRVAEGLRRDRRRRGQRAHGHAARRVGGQPGRLRRLAEADRQRPRRRTAPGP